MTPSSVSALNRRHPTIAATGITLSLCNLTGAIAQKELGCGTVTLSDILTPVKRIFKTRYFNRWSRKTELTDESLCKAVSEMERGLVDADLGGGVVKKRVALPGRGKRGGARTLVVTNRGDRWFFVYGFEKSVRANILAEDLEGLREIAKQLLDRTSAQLDQTVRDGSLQEICHDEKTQDQEPHP